MRKNALANTENIASLAPQDINGDIIKVIRRSLRVSKVLAAIIEATLQPKPTINGTKALPDKPIDCINLSITKAARDI